MATRAQDSDKTPTKRAAGRSAAAKGAVTRKAPSRPRKASASRSGTAKAATTKPTAARAAAKNMAATITADVKSAADTVAKKAAAAPAAVKEAAASAVAATPATAKAVSEKAVSAVSASVPAKLPAKSKAVSKRSATSRTNSRATAKRRAAPSIGTGTVLGVAAAGLAAGLVANLGRKAAVQAPSVMAGDWLEALKGEHKAALALVEQLSKTSPDQPAKRTMLLGQIRHALSRHAFTEENVIYPALREWGDKADADHLAHDQGYHKQYLYELDGMDKASPEFAIKVADLRADLEAHIREEEEDIFPKIHAALSEEKNKALTGLANREGFRLA